MKQIGMAYLGVLLAIGVGMLGGGPPAVGAADRVELRSARGEVFVGERTAFALSIDAPGAVLLEVIPVDAQGWRAAGVTGAASPFQIMMIPLRAGEVRLLVQVTYATRGNRASVVTGSETVTVRPVREGVTVVVTSGQGVLMVRSYWQASVTVHNTTPYTLTGVTFATGGAGLSWDAPALPIDQIPPGGDLTAMLRARITREDFAPHLRLAFEWQDDSGASYACQEEIQVDTPPVVQTMGQLLREAGPMVGGALLGAIISTTAYLSKDWVEARRRRRVLGDRLRRLLQLSLIEGRTALLAYDEVRLDALEQVYRADAEYNAILERMGLLQAAQDYYEAAFRYNGSRRRPGAGRADDELRKAMEQLESKLRVKVSRGLLLARLVRTRRV